MPRPPLILHTASEPLDLFGRADELALLDAALAGGPSVAAFLGPGGQGKTAIVQTWLRRQTTPVDGLFFWSFYRGKDADLCLRTWFGYASGRDGVPDVSAAFAAQKLAEILRRERWAVVLDGAEVVQHEDGPWRGRFTHPDLGLLLADLASEPTPGVIALTSRFDMPELTRRPFFRAVELDRLDPASARTLLQRLGVTGDDAALDAVAAAAGRHAKAVELAGTLLAAFNGGRPDASLIGGGEDDVEAAVSRVLTAFGNRLSEQRQDLIALATSFRSPPAEPMLLDFLASDAAHALIHDHWGRTYPHFPGREWLAAEVAELIHLRLLERVGTGVIDAHPLVRRGFERGQAAGARAGFLRGRPDRRTPATLEEAGPAVELFHAHLDAGNYAEADAAFVGLDNPKHRLLAPALEVGLLSRFFPNGDLRAPPIWPGFGRWRSLAIGLEMLGRFDEALGVYRPGDAGLRGDALLARGRAAEVAAVEQVPSPWQNLWRAYRCHALCLLGRVGEAVALARAVIPTDVYEWAHVFECLLRAGRLEGFDARGLRDDGHAWAALTARRIRADLRRVTQPGADLRGEYRALIEAYDRAGLPYERALTRLSLAAHGGEELDAALALIERYGLDGLAADAWALKGDAAKERQWRERTGLVGPRRR
jgi:hypothetical protein